MTFRTSNVHNFPLHLWILDNQFFCYSKYCLHIMYTIFRSIYTILDIQFFLQIQTLRTYNLHNFPLNLCHSGFKFFCKSRHSVHNVNNFLLNIRNSTYSIFLSIQTICTYNVHNFLLNLCNSGYSIFLQIKTFHTYNVHSFL